MSGRGLRPHTSRTPTEVSYVPFAINLVGRTKSVSPQTLPVNTPYLRFYYCVPNKKERKNETVVTLITEMKIPKT